MNTAQVATPTEASTEPTPVNVADIPTLALAMNPVPEHDTDVHGHTADAPIVIASDSDSDLAKVDNNNPKST